MLARVKTEQVDFINAEQRALRQLAQVVAQQPDDAGAGRWIGVGDELLPGQRCSPLAQKRGQGEDESVELIVERRTKGKPEGARRLSGQGASEGGLADAGRAGQGHRAASPQHGHGRIQLALPADQGRPGRRLEPQGRLDDRGKRVSQLRQGRVAMAIVGGPAHVQFARDTNDGQFRLAAEIGGIKQAAGIVGQRRRRLSQTLAQGIPAGGRIAGGGLPQHISRRERRLRAQPGRIGQVVERGVQRFQEWIGRRHQNTETAPRKIETPDREFPV